MFVPMESSDESDTEKVLIFDAEDSSMNTPFTLDMLHRKGGGLYSFDGGREEVSNGYPLKLLNSVCLLHFYYFHV